METGACRKMDLDYGLRTRLRQRVCDKDDLSIHVLQLLGMIVTAWAIIVRAGASPRFARESLIMRGDSMSAVYWVNDCLGGKEQRSRALMRIWDV